MMDLKRARLIVLSHPFFSIDMRTLLFFTERGMPLQNVVAANPGKSVIENRNQIMESLVFKNLNDFDWFIFMDRDQYPQGVDDLLFEEFIQDTEAEVVGATYDTGNQKAWIDPTQFHMGCVRVHTSILSQLELPVFQFSYNENHTSIAECECSSFRKRLLEAGSKIERRGYVQHDKERSWQNLRYCN